MVLNLAQDRLLPASLPFMPPSFMEPQKQRPSLGSRRDFLGLTVEAAQAGVSLALPGPWERHGKLASITSPGYGTSLVASFICGSSPGLLSVCRQLEKPVQRPGWSGRGEGSVGSRCVSCRKTSPSEGRGSTVWGWAGGAGPSIANGVPGLHTRERRWLFLVPPKALVAQKARWHRTGVGCGTVTAQRARGMLAGLGGW